MPLGLVRYQDTGNPHFVTFSCYHRLKFFSSSVTHVDQVGDNSHNSSVPHICPPLADVGKGYQEPSVPHICPPQLEERSYLWGRYHLFVAKFDLVEIKAAITDTFEKQSGETWADVARKLTAFGHWEFD